MWTKKRSLAGRRVRTTLLLKRRDARHDRSTWRSLNLNDNVSAAFDKLAADVLYVVNCAVNSLYCFDLIEKDRYVRGYPNRFPTF